ncbi:hypothetical protein E3J62_08195 [candidate division TA06 bacterium]|uniref:Uncharacterized protein n=1 Tax=candidate division TA06 bacterium TaxID=2250710 RepID=A0A523URK2_UNCT6|nr:MAG: hypothetical protein E3J62_08195 [candidate division TA06 bacterium]
MKDEFWSTHLDKKENLALELATIRVLHPTKNELNDDPLEAEIDFEKRRLERASIKSGGIFYDATRLVSLYWRLIPKEGRRSNVCHLILTRELFGTWDRDDLRWHARAVMLGYPCLVSATGLVEAPAKPSEYYQRRNAGVDVASLKEEMGEHFIDYGDERMIEVLKGYCAQAVFYSMTRQAFCDDPGCRLFNAHWQVELIYAQIGGPYEFCEKHTRMIEKLKAGT